MPRVDSSSTKTWLSYLRRYFILLAAGNLIWESLHMPLYTLWTEGTSGQIVLYGLHCLAGDMLIGASSLLIALLLFARPGWPRESYLSTASATVLLGFVYTIWSEWYNVNISGSWSYSDRMPVIPTLEVGISPALQWIFIPIACFWVLRRFRESS